MCALSNLVGHKARLHDKSFWHGTPKFWPAYQKLWHGTLEYCRVNVYDMGTRAQNFRSAEPVWIGSLGPPKMGYRAQKNVASAIFNSWSCADGNNS